MFVQDFEKLQHIPVNIEGCMHVQGHMHPQGGEEVVTDCTCGTT